MTLTKGERTRGRLVETMVRLIQTQGYSGTGLNTAVREAEAPRGSLYFHFPEGKEELGEEAVALAAEAYTALLADARSAAGTAGEALAAVVRRVAEQLTESGFRMGCPVSVVALEMGTSSERLREACTTAFDAWIGAVAELLVADGMPPERAGRVATVAISTVEGAIIISRTRRDTAPLLAAADAVRELVDR